MTEEIKVTNETEKKEGCNCFCHSEGFRRFLTIALGTFVGVYAALSLFAATHRPPMPFGGFGFGAPGFAPCPYQKVIHHRHFKGHDVKFDKKVPGDFGRKAPFDAQKSVKDDD